MDRVRKALLALGILPLVASLAAWARPMSPVPMGPPLERPSLAFEQYAVHLGAVAPAPAVGANFSFINRSEKVVRITGLKPSCGCVVTKVVDQRKDYRPGEFGMFQASLATANEKPGPHDYTIKVSYDDGQPREQVVRMTLTLPEPTIQLEPTEVYFYQLNGEPNSRIVHVVDYRRHSLEVTSVQMQMGREPFPTKLATAELLPAVKTEAGLTRIPIRINVSGDIPPTRMIPHLIIKTNDPEFATLKLPVLIQGPKAAVVPASASESVPESTVPSLVR